jgi:hypothetical protein
MMELDLCAMMRNCYNGVQCSYKDRSYNLLRVGLSVDPPLRIVTTEIGTTDVEI